MAGMSTHPFKCDLCGGVTDAPTYGDFNCQHCGQAFVYDECHQIKLSEPQLEALRQMPVIGRLGDQVMKDIVQAFAGVPKWIPVSERLPEDRQRVIACFPPLRPGDSTDVCAATFNKAQGWFAMEHGCYTATHWMPLPEPPEAK